MKPTNTILLTAAVTLLCVLVIGATHTQQSQHGRYQLVIGTVWLTGSGPTATCWRIDTVTGDAWLWTPMNGFVPEKTSKFPITGKSPEALPKNPRLVPDD